MDFDPLAGGKTLDELTIKVTRMQISGIEYEQACRIACENLLYAFCHSAIAAGIEKSEVHELIEAYYSKISQLRKH